MNLEAVTFDIGGIIYSDSVFKRSIYRALDELSGGIDSQRFEEIYDNHLESQSGSLRSKLCIAFFGNLDRKEELMERATGYWVFEDSDLYNDAIPCITHMKSLGCRIGIVANQAATVVDSLNLHRITPLIDFMGVSAIVGVEKPDPEIYRKALNSLGTDPSKTLHVGNRLDTDVLPAQGLGMRTAWILRGEANPHPTPKDLETPDIVLPSLENLSELIVTLP
jgi:putative hydrolase of the HAD superfamily